MRIAYAYARGTRVLRARTSGSACAVMCGTIPVRDSVLASSSRTWCLQPCAVPRVKPKTHAQQVVYRSRLHACSILSLQIASLGATSRLQQDGTRMYSRVASTAAVTDTLLNGPRGPAAHAARRPTRFRVRRGVVHSTCSATGNNSTDLAPVVSAGVRWEPHVDIDGKDARLCLKRLNAIMHDAMMARTRSAQQQHAQHLSTNQDLQREHQDRAGVCHQIMYAPRARNERTQRR